MKKQIINKILSCLLVGICLMSVFSVFAFADNGARNGTTLREPFKLNRIEFPSPSFEIDKGVITPPFNYILPDNPTIQPSTSSSSKFALDNTMLGYYWETTLTSNNNLGYNGGVGYRLTNFLYGKAIDYLTNPMSRVDVQYQLFKSVKYCYEDIMFGDKYDAKFAPTIKISCDNVDEILNKRINVLVDYSFIINPTNEVGVADDFVVTGGYRTSLDHTNGVFTCSVDEIIDAIIHNNNQSTILKGIKHLSIHLEADNEDGYDYTTYCLQYQTTLLPDADCKEIASYQFTKIRVQQVINSRNFSDMLDWLGDVLQGFLNTPLFVVGNINISIGTIITTIFGLLFAFVFIRFFSGG